MTINNRFFKIGICDWTLNMVQNENVFEKAKYLGFDGVQVAFDIKDRDRSLINDDVQQRYKSKSNQHHVAMCSCAAINFLQTPLAISKDPLLIFSDYIKAMHNLGLKIILLPFFGRGDINPRTTRVSSIVRQIRKIPRKDKMLAGTIDILKNIAGLAEAEEITVGLETLMNAESLNEVLDKIGSKSIKVYYDAGNARLMRYNIPDEIKMLGMSNICQFHFKERYTTIGNGQIDYNRIFELLIAGGYDNWLILEKSINPFLGLNASMKKNISFLRGLMQQDHFVKSSTHSFAIKR